MKKQIVIEISEYVIDDMKECGFIPEEDNEELYKAIVNGTVLEPHGRCVDADALVKEYGKYDIGVFVNKADTILEAWGNEE